MSNQNNNPVEKSVSPEHVSLEERFARVDTHGERASIARAKEQEVYAERSAAESDATYQTILSKVETAKTQVDDATVMADASVLDQQVDRESQITHLIDLATTKGVEHAVKVAQKAEDYYILDQLHDRLLADDLHSALLAKGLIEE